MNKNSFQIFYVENYKICFDGSPVSIAHNNINFCIQDPNHPTKKLLIYRDNLLWYDRLLEHIGKFSHGPFNGNTFKLLMFNEQITKKIKIAWNMKDIGGL